MSITVLKNDIKLNKMVLISVWPLSTNTMGIETTDFVLLVENSRDKMQMLSLEEGMT